MGNILLGFFFFLCMKTQFSANLWFILLSFSSSRLPNITVYHKYVALPFDYLLWDVNSFLPVQLLSCFQFFTTKNYISNQCPWTHIFNLIFDKAPNWGALLTQISECLWTVSAHLLCPPLDRQTCFVSRQKQNPAGNSSGGKRGLL